MKIAVFGGSFNPVHTGHAIIASVAAQDPEIDEVWMMVSPQNPLKEDNSLVDEDERLRLVRKVAAECEDVVGSDFEFGLPRPSFTYNTLRELKKRYPQHEFRILIGSDNWKIFDHWRNSSEIISEFGVIIYQRPDDPADGPFPEGVRLLTDVPLMMISSTDIRKRLKNGSDVRFMVPDIIYNDLKQWKKIK